MRRPPSYQPRGHQGGGVRLHQKQGRATVERRYLRGPQKPNAGGGGRSERRLSATQIGASYTFAGADGGRWFVFKATSQKASEVAADVPGEVARRPRETGDRVQETASAARTSASEQFDRVSSAVADGTNQAREVADAAGAAVASNSQKIADGAGSAGAIISERANSLKDDGLRLAGSAAATVQDIATGATAAARSAANTVADTGMDAARTIRNKASDASDRAGKTIFQTIDQNPLLVAGVGLLVGGLIASALPRSEFEDDLVGDASTAAKRRAQAAASQGFDAAKTAVGQVYEETARQAEAEGLTTDGLGRAAQDISQRVRRVAETAVTTALAPSEQDHQPNPHGENDHG